MPGPARAGAVIYVKDLARLSAFYQAVLGMALRHAEADHQVIESADLQLVIHAIPAQIADSFTIETPPVPRDEQAIKLFFTVDSLAQARARAHALGGEVGDAGWAGPGFVAHNAHDPEGNIFQLRATRTD